MVNFKQYRILIVDDNQLARQTCRHLLTAEEGAGDFEVLEAGTGTEGLWRCRTEHPDCVLLDYLLPDVDGLEFITSLTNEHGDMAAPVIMITGYADYTVAVRAIKGGAADYLTKDKVTEHGLRRAITNAIEKAALHRQIALQRREVEHLASTDILTDLPNRRVLLERLGSELRRRRRYGAAVCFLLLDLDHFKRINDTHGHLIGDQILASVGQLLRTELRDLDMAGRYGGEEFGIVLPSTDLAAGRELAERMRGRLASAVYVLGHGQTFQVTGSFGLAEAEGFDQTISDLLTRADQALYDAKAGGRNRVHISIGPMTTTSAGPINRGTMPAQPLVRILLTEENLGEGERP